MNAEQFVENVRDLLHERAKATGLVPAADLAGLLQQVEVVFGDAGMPDEDSPADLRKTLDEVQSDLETAERDRDDFKAAEKRLKGEVVRLEARIAEFGDDPDTARAEEVERLRALMRDSADLFIGLASDLAAPRARKERIVAAMRGQAAQIYAEVGEGDDE